MRLFILAAFAVCCSLGCQNDQCRQMTECCNASSDLEGVGEACGQLAGQTSDPSTCAVVSKTLVAMYESKGKQPPKACEIK